MREILLYGHNNSSSQYTFQSYFQVFGPLSGHFLHFSRKIQKFKDEKHEKSQNGLKSRRILASVTSIAPSTRSNGRGRREIAQPRISTPNLRRRRLWQRWRKSSLLRKRSKSLWKWRARTRRRIPCPPPLQPRPGSCRWPSQPRRRPALLREHPQTLRRTSFIG